MDKLLIITSDYFVAGVVLCFRDNRWETFRVAPILNYMKNWRHSKIREYAINQNWQLEYID